MGARLAALLGLTPRFDRRPMQVGLPLVQASKAAAATNPGGLKTLVALVLLGQPVTSLR